MPSSTSILLRRKNKLIVPSGNNSLPPTVLATINKNLEGLGYTLSDKALDAVATLSDQEVHQLYRELISTLRDLRGVKDYRPMYPNFPGQVMEASAATLYLNAIRHYLTVWVSDLTNDKLREFVWLPNYRKENRAALNDEVKLTVIELGTEEELRDIFEKVISSKTSISETDRTELAWFAKSYKLELPTAIPNKEVLAFVAALVPDRPELKQHIKTATDVLRIAVAMSEGDVSLAEPTKFRQFSRKERRAILALLDHCGNAIEDMLRWRSRWLRLGERLHPGEYKKQFPNAMLSFDVLRNALRFETFNSQVENALKTDNVDKAIDLLRDRPGEFARRLDHLLRLRPTRKLIAEFGEVAQTVSTPVLLQTIAHFKYRSVHQDLRIFFPKGNVAKVKAITNNLTPIPLPLCNLLVEICEGQLIDRFSRLSSLGKVFIDEDLRSYLVPFSQRSASKSLRTLVRGSRINFAQDKDTVRFFLWWREGEVNDKHTDRVDLDLSAMMFDDRWNYKEHISYTNLRSAAYRSFHSGDITSAPDGACEFIDLDIPSVVKYGGRYVVMSVNSFTGQNFLDLPECKAGWMMREDPDSGEIFEPRTVEDRLDITSDTMICLPVILDLHERKAIWADLALKRNVNYVNNVEGNSSQMTLIGKAITEILKPDLYGLFTLHAKARGILVDKKDEADTVFSVDNGITPIDVEIISAEYL